MSAARIRRPWTYRRLAKTGWLLVGLALTVEVAGFLASREIPISRYNASINRDTVVELPNAHGGAGGKFTIHRSDQYAQYAVFDEFVDGPGLLPEQTGRYHLFGLHYPYTQSGFSIDLSRTKRVGLGDPSGKIFFVHGFEVITENLPPKVTVESLLAFGRSAESAGGIEAYRRWRDRQPH